MKNLQKWMVSTFFLFMQFSVYATNTKHIVPLDLQNSVYRIIEDIEEDYKNDVINLSKQNIDDRTVVRAIEEYTNINPFDSPRNYFRYGSINLSDNLLTDSGAISLACTIENLSQIRKLNICHNSVTDIGIKAIFIKSFEKKEVFTFCFTAQQDIKPGIEELAQKYKKPLVWDQNALSLKNIFDFKVCIGHQTISLLDLKDAFE